MWAALQMQERILGDRVVVFKLTLFLRNTGRALIAPPVASRPTSKALRHRTDKRRGKGNGAVRPMPQGYGPSLGYLVVLLLTFVLCTLGGDGRQIVQLVQHATQVKVCALMGGQH